MVLIIGGAYQGKLDYVLEKYNLNRDDVFNCEGLFIDFGKKVINDFEKYISACNEEGKEAIEVFQTNAKRYRKDSEVNILSDKIIVCDDVSQGIVPVAKNDRSYREMSGRCLIQLAKESSEVIRVFCGLGTKIK